MATKSCAPIIRVFETTPKGNVKHTRKHQPYDILRTRKLLSQKYQTRPRNIAGPSTVSWRPQNVLQIRAPETLLTNEPSTYGPGLLSERCRESDIPLTRWRRRILERYLMPSTTLPVDRGGTRPSRRNCHATTQYGVGLKFSDDRPLGPA